MNTRHRFRVAHRAVRRMVRAARMPDTAAARCEYFEAILSLDAADARPLFPAALRCHSATRPDTP
ncbi:MAG: hypothetical protein WC809_18690 [Sinimarinibacterium sp.]|jgi:hypothetical protein